MTSSNVRIGVADNKIFIAFPEYEKTLDTTCSSISSVLPNCCYDLMSKIVAKILNIITHYLPCLTDGAAEIQLNGKSYYVYRSSLAAVLQCDAQAPCSNYAELKVLALAYFNTRAEQPSRARIPSGMEPQVSALERQAMDFQQNMERRIADKRKSDKQARNNLKVYRETSKKKLEGQIAELRAAVAHLPPNNPRRLANEKFIKTLIETEASGHNNLDEIATASGIA